MSCIFSRELKEKGGLAGHSQIISEVSPPGAQIANRLQQASSPNLKMKTRVGQAKGLACASGSHLARGLASGHSGNAAPGETGASDSIIPLWASSSQLVSCFPETSLSQISSVDGNARCFSPEQSPGQYLVSWPRSQAARKQMAGPPCPLHSHLPRGL